MLAGLFFLALSYQQAIEDADRRVETDIVVIGKRLRDAGDELEDCIKRKCPTDQDVAATIKVVEMQFLAGEYRGARKTLRQSIGRNSKQAKAYPLPVAALWRSKARVDTHLGEYEDFRSGAIQSYQVLKNGLPADDPNVLGGLIELGDAQFQLGYWIYAEEHYTDAIARAARANNHQIEAIARYRLAGVIARRNPNGPSSGDEKEVAKILAPLIGSSDPVFARYDFIARLYKARLAEKRGAKAAVDVVLASLPKGITPPPILLSSRPIKLVSFAASGCADNVANPNPLACDIPRNMVSVNDVENQWIDVGFLIDPAGSVRDIEIVRKSAKFAGDWGERVTKSIASRRYTPSPSATDTTTQGRYRIERFTLTAPFITLTGGRQRVRSINATIATMDLTPG